MRRAQLFPYKDRKALMERITNDFISGDHLDENGLKILATKMMILKYSKHKEFPENRFYMECPYCTYFNQHILTSCTACPWKDFTHYPEYNCERWTEDNVNKDMTVQDLVEHKSTRRNRLNQLYEWLAHYMGETYER